MAEIGQLIQRPLDEVWGTARPKVRKHMIMDS